MASDEMSRLGRVMAEQGRRGVWLARHLEVHESTISRWCSGETAVPDWRVPQLAELLGVDESEITEAVTA